MGNTNKIQILIKLQDKWPVISISENISSFGYDPTEFINGLRFGSLLPETEFNRVNSILKSNFSQNQYPLQLPFNFFSKSGELRSVNSTIEKNEQGYLISFDSISSLEIKDDNLLKLYRTASELGGLYLFILDIRSHQMYSNWDIFKQEVGDELKIIKDWEDLILQKDRDRVKEIIKEAITSGKGFSDLEFGLKAKDEEVIFVKCRGRIELDNNNVPVMLFGVMKDITQEKDFINTSEGNNKMMKFLIDILKQKSLDMNSIYEYAMEQAIALTESKIGYIYLYNEETKKFILLNWSKEVMEQCKVTEPRTQYDLDKTGVWGEVVRQRKPIIVNDFKTPNEHLKGTPQGHAPLLKWCAIPVFKDEKIIATLGVANKDEDYTDEDVRLLNLLMEGVLEYITDLGIEEELEKKKQELSNYLDIAPMIVMERDRDGKITYINNNGARILGSTPKEMIGKNWFTEHITGENSKSMHDVFDKLWNGQMKKEETYTFEVQTKDGKKKTILWQSTLIMDNEGVPYSIMSSGQDITERETLLSQIKTDEAKFSAYIKEAPITILVLDKEGRYKEVNDAAVMLLGYSKEELISMTLLQILAESNYRESVQGFQTLIGTGRYKGEHIFKTKDKRKIIGVVNAVKIDEDTYIAFINDITAQVEYTNKISQHNAELSKMNKLMIDRELKMRQLKAELMALKAKET